MKTNRLWVVFLVLVGVGCGGEPLPADVDDLALQRQTISWPLTGGLDTKTGPLAVQPGSFLVLDDVTSERASEWRRRNGFANDPLDTMPETSPYFVANVGDRGIYEDGQGGFATYQPSLATSRWTTHVVTAPPQVRKRTPLVATDDAIATFARAGNVLAIASFPAASSSTVLTIFDMGSVSVISRTTLSVGAIFQSRCAATANGIAVGIAGAGGVLSLYGVSTLGVLGTAVVVPGSFSQVDAHYYSGSTVTFVARRTTDSALVAIEFDPSTSTVVSNAVVAGATVTTGMSLLDDADATGFRYVSWSNATPTSHVTKFTATGGVVTDDVIEAIQARKITGVATENGAGWNVIYNISAGVTNNLRVNAKSGGSVGTAAAFQGSTTWGDVAATTTLTTIDTPAWRVQGQATWNVILGLHSLSASDPQDTYVEFSIPTGATATATPTSVLVPGAGSPGVPTLIIGNVQRTSKFTFSMVLPVQVIYENNAGTISRHYSLDLFEQTYLQGSDIGTAPIQKPLQYKQTSYLPAGQLSYYDEGIIRRLGTLTRPRQLTVTPSIGAGSLTGGATYLWCAVVETIDSDGNIWRSPPSVQTTVTMGATQNTAAVTYSSWAVDTNVVRVSLYRTAGNGSLFKRWTSFLAAPGADVVTNDLNADSALTNAELLYTTGEQPTALVQAPRLVFFFDDRQWYVPQEYPTELDYSKNLRPGRQPEYTDQNILDQDDEYGEFTAGIGFGDKGVLFKRNAIYFIQGQGLTDAGSGQNYSLVLVSHEAGAIPGSPVVAAGDTLYFVSDRGIYSINRNAQVAFAGAAVDGFLHQPLVQTPETIYDGVFDPIANEVVFATTNYLLRFNRTFGHWKRSRFAGVRHLLVVNRQLVAIKSDGSMWREGDQTQLTDGGSDFSGIIRSPWITPTNAEGWVRLYSGRAVAMRTAGGSAVMPEFSEFFDFDDSTEVDFGPASPVPGDATQVRIQGKPHPSRQKCTAFSLEVTLPSGDNTFRLTNWAAEIGVKQGAQRASGGALWKGPNE